MSRFYENPMNQPTAGPKRTSSPDWLERTNYGFYGDDSDDFIKQLAEYKIKRDSKERLAEKRASSLYGDDSTKFLQDLENFETKRYMGPFNKAPNREALLKAYMKLLGGNR